MIRKLIQTRTYTYTAGARAVKMKVHSCFLDYVHLDPTYSLLSGRDVSVLLEFFKALDFRGELAIDGIEVHTNTINLIIICFP